MKSVSQTTEKIIFSCLKTQIERSHTNQICKFYGSFQLGFFPRYQGLTIANAIRRTILLESRQYAITGVKIENVNHEYSSLKGIKETVFDILVNLQNIILYAQKPFLKTQIVILLETGPKVIQAHHLKLPAFLYCINKAQPIVTLESNVQLKMIVFIDHISFFASCFYTPQYYKELYIQLTQGQKKTPIIHTDFLLLNTKISPVINVNYTIKKSTNQQEIILFDIWTDGSIHPSFLLRKSIQKLLILFLPFHRLKYSNETNSPNIQQKVFIQKFLHLDLCHFALSMQTYTNLSQLGIYTLGDLYKFSMNPTNSLISTLSEKERNKIDHVFKQIRQYFQSI